MSQMTLVPGFVGAVTNMQLKSYPWITNLILRCEDHYFGYIGNSKLNKVLSKEVTLVAVTRYVSSQINHTYCIHVNHITIE